MSVCRMDDAPLGGEVNTVQQLLTIQVKFTTSEVLSVIVTFGNCLRRWSQACSRNPGFPI